ncbi:hypothetical protein LTS18_003583 [Coniosporium uncinatum]|uniref:Uncharacterized protein n=1 Tax=Coniosporium uncinatum TaxID=93489 RepID=A0ACC3DBF5_9PEZI|nr:hypothetical protein LTS18_003583 [Coniosporium uncinatum]
MPSIRMPSSSIFDYILEDLSLQTTAENRDGANEGEVPIEGEEPIEGPDDRSDTDYERPAHLQQEMDQQQLIRNQQKTNSNVSGDVGTHERERPASEHGQHAGSSRSNANWEEELEGLPEGLQQLLKLPMKLFSNSGHASEESRSASQLSDLH